MKRLLMVLLLGLTVTPLAACGGDEDQAGVVDPTQPSWAQEKINLNYAVVSKLEDSTVPSIEELMLEEFEAKYPNITVTPVQIDWSVSDTWTSKITELTTTGTVIDVFLVPRVEDLAKTGYLADITSFYDNDEDTDAIFDHVAALGEFEGTRYTVPTFIYPSFWVVNENLLKEANVTIPQNNWTWEAMEGAAKSVASLSNKHGLYDTQAYTYEYPKLVSGNDSWYARSYDGEKFNYDSTAMQTAMSDLSTGMNEGWITPNQMTTADLDPRYLGEVGIWRQPAWEFKDYATELEFNYKILPAPSSAGMGNTDVAAVHSMSKNKEAAYNLLKWMSYDEEGILKRFEIYNDNIEEIGLAGNNFPYPVADYGMGNDGVNKIWDSIPYANLGTPFASLSSPEFLLSIENAAIQANKEVVGWNASDIAINEYFASIESFEAEYADLKDSIQASSTAAIIKARDDLKKALGL